MQRFGRCRNVELRRRLKSAGRRRRCRRSGPGPPSPNRAVSPASHSHDMDRAWDGPRACPCGGGGAPCPAAHDGFSSRLDMQRLWSRRMRPNPSIAPTDPLDRHVYLVLKILERAPAAPGARRTKPIQTSRQSCRTSSPVTATTERDFQNHRPARRCSTMSFVARLVELDWELLTVARLF